jgi:putative ABC transport system substrate-binding protein
VPQVGVLFQSASDNPASAGYTQALRDGLSEYGYHESRNVKLVVMSADGRLDRLPDLAAGLVRLPVDVAVTGGSPPTVAVRNATSTIPIVMANSTDPVGLGLVETLARPGANVTGLSDIGAGLSGKRLELLKETVPGLSRVAVLWEPANQGAWLQVEQAQGAAAALGVEVQPLEIWNPDDLPRAFDAAVQWRADAVQVSAGTLSAYDSVIEMAAKHRLPATYANPQSVAAGGLMAYGPNVAAMWRRAGYFVDRILRGAKPADLPVEQPMRFDFVINLKTAQALGLTIPQHVLLQATEVIQ